MTKTSTSTVVLGIGLCAGLTFCATGCDGDSDFAEARRFRVRIENISAPLDTSQGPQATALSPGVFVVFNSDGNNPLFRESDPATVGLERLAEDGDPGPLQAEVVNTEDVSDAGVFGQNPIGTGGVFEFTITGRPGDRLSFATMYMATNDLFLSTEDEDGIELFNQNVPIDDEVTDLVALWDAGTEVNEEPGVGPTTKPNQPSNNFGAPENGVVQLIEDTNDPFVFPDADTIMRVTIDLIDD